MDGRNVDLLVSFTRRRFPQLDEQHLTMLLANTDCDGHAFAYPLPQYGDEDTRLIYVLENKLASPLSGFDILRGLNSDSAGYLKSLRSNRFIVDLLQENPCPYSLLGIHTKTLEKYLQVKPVLMVPAQSSAAFEQWEEENAWYSVRRRTA